MLVSFRGVLVMMLALLVPAGAEAGLFFNPFDTCGVCRPQPWIGFTFALPLPNFCPPPPCPCPPGPCACGPALPPPGQCGCGPTLAPPISPPMDYGPMLPPVSTGYCPAPPVCATVQPRQVTTYRNVPTTQYRREAYVENVPVTTYQQITVPQTVYQQQTRYRDVAYTVNQQVAQTHTEYIQQPQISYLPQQPMAAAPCSTCNQSAAFGLSPQFAAPSYSTANIAPYAPYIGEPANTVPTPIALPQSIGMPSSSAATLQPPQASADPNWQTIPQRQAQGQYGVQQMGGYLPAYSPPPQSRTQSMFQPAPSAASVWQSQWMR